MFRLLAADAKTAELSTVRRFSDPWEAEATRRLRDRDSSVLAEYQAGAACGPAGGNRPWTPPTRPGPTPDERAAP